MNDLRSLVELKAADLGKPSPYRQGSLLPEPPPRPDGAADEWYTPTKVFDPLNARFAFTLDACATAESAKATRFYALEDDGLSRSWEGERVWCNPPYSPGNLARWVEKCAAEGRGALVVALVPAWTDRRWWHEFVEPDRQGGLCSVEFIRGRVRFGWPGNPSGRGGDTCSFPSVVLIWRGGWRP